MKKVSLEQINRIATRYVNLLDNFGLMEGRSRGTVKGSCAVALLDWNEREPLNFDVLEAFPDCDFTHDLGGIMRGDTLMSARSAMIYHPKKAA